MHNCFFNYNKKGPLILLIFNNLINSYDSMKRNMQQKHLNEHLQRHNSPSLPKYTISEYMKQKQLPILLPPPMSRRHGKEDAARPNLYQSFQIKGFRPLLVREYPKEFRLTTFLCHFLSVCFYVAGLRAAH